MTIYRILAACIIPMHQSGKLISSEPQEIILRQLDIVYQALGKISRGNSADVVVQKALENPCYMAELTQKAQLYGSNTEKIVASLIRATKNARPQHYLYPHKSISNK